MNVRRKSLGRLGAMGLMMLAVATTSGILLSSCATPPHSPTAYESLLLSQAFERENPLQPPVQAALDQLVQEFHQLLISLFPDYNGISVEATRVAYSEQSTIWANHPFFSQYTMAVGPAGPTIERWLYVHQRQLTEAHVSKVFLGSSVIYGRRRAHAVPP